MTALPITRPDLSSGDLRVAAAEACAMDRQTLCDWVRRTTITVSTACPIIPIPARGLF
jgi:hypothetical protein